MKGNPTIPALRTAALYLIISVLWLTCADWLLAQLIHDLASFEFWSMMTEFGFLTITAALLFLQLRHQLKRSQVEADSRTALENKAEIIADGSMYLAYLIEKSEQPIAIGYLNGAVGEVNAAFCELTGFTLRELRQMDFRRGLTPSKWWELDDKLMSDLDSTGMSVRYEKEYQRKDGTLIPVEVFAHKSRDRAGNPCVLAFVTNISKRKQAEEALTRNESLYRSLFELCPDGIVLEDEQGRILDVNEALCRQTGYSHDELLGRSVHSLASPDTIAAVKTNLETLNSGIALNHQVWNRRKDGSSYLAELHEKQISLPDGRKGILVATKDVSERERVLQLLRRRESIFAAVSSTAEMFLHADNLDAAVSDGLARLGTAAQTSCVVMFEMEDGPEVAGRFNRRFEWRASQTPCCDTPAFIKLGTMVERLRQGDVIQGPVQDFPEFERPLFNCPQIRSTALVPIMVEQKLWGILAFEECAYERRWEKAEIEALQLAARIIGGTISRQRANAALIASENQYRTLTEGLPDMVWHKDQAGAYVFCNRKYAAALKRQPHEIIGRHDTDFHPADLAARYRQDDQRVITSGQSIQVEEEGEFNGIRGWWLTNKVPLNDAQGRCVGTVGIATNITALKRAEEALRVSEESYRSFFDTTSDAVYVLNREGIFVAVNEGAVEMYGYKKEEFVGKTPEFLSAPLQNDLQLAMTAIQNAFAGEAQHFEWWGMRKNGEVFPKEVILKSGIYFGQTVVFATGRDITNRREAEEKLRKLSRAVEQSPVSIVITDRKGDIEYVNPRFTQITGYALKDVLGKSPRVLKSGEMREDTYRELWRTITGGSEWSGEFHNRKRNGELYWEYASISPIVNEAGKITHFLAIKEDITARKQMEDNLRQAQKMESIGRLAGGVAHDFNNLLTIIQLQAELMQTEAATNLSAIKDSCTEILNAARRGANLTKQLLVFSRRQVIRPRDLDLNSLIETTGKMLRRIVGEDIRINMLLSGLPLFVHADEGMLDQVLMNLTVNARDAMPNGGQLTLETSRVTINAAEAATLAGARAGRFARLTVRDTGAGIPPELHTKIFEPFFTTKELGKGTGLGLATVFGIVQQHHGWITLSSEPGKGATFAVYLPLVASRASGEPGDAPRLQELRGGTETIFLVEDEKSVATMVHNALRRFGYKVIEAGTSATALELWLAHKDEINLVLTDLVIPGDLTGRQLAQRFLADQPELKTIYMSGYSPEIAAKDLQLEDGHNFLPKPFPAHKLIQTVRKRLDSPTA